MLETFVHCSWYTVRNHLFVYSNLMTTKGNHHSNAASCVSVRQLRGSARSYFLFHLLVSSICFVSSPDEIYEETHPAVEAFRAFLQPLFPQGVPPLTTLKPTLTWLCLRRMRLGCRSRSALSSSLFSPHSGAGKPAVSLTGGLVSSHLQLHGSPRSLRLHV